MNRALLSIGRNALGLRNLHKGIDSTPPLRYMPIPEKIGLFALIAFTMLSYPTYVLLNLDNLRPKADNKLSDEVQAQIDEIRASRK